MGYFQSDISILFLFNQEENKYGQWMEMMGQVSPSGLGQGILS